MDSALTSKPRRGGRACPRGDEEMLQRGRRGMVTWLWCIACVGMCIRRNTPSSWRDEPGQTNTMPAEML